MSESRGWDTDESGEAAINDLDRFRKRPLEGPSDSMIDTAEARLSKEPHRVPSSRYQAFIRRSGTSRLIRSIIGCKVKANPRGPRGSPC